MHLTNCEHPIEILQHGEKKYVPCGKCDYCRTVRSSGMANRITLEMRAHKFGVFFTLTYAEMNLPKYLYVPEQRGFVVPSYDFDNANFLLGTDDCGNFISAPYVSDGSKKIIDSYQNRLGFIPFLRKKDFQDFVKRVRIAIARHPDLKYEEKESLQITYAICGEYGPTTFKPHGHGLFMFDNEKLARVIHEIIHKAWPYGSSRSRFTKFDEKSDYIAKYINGINRLPNIFRIREVRPFLLVSKRRPIGLAGFSKEEIEKVITRGTYEILHKDVRTNEVQSVVCPSQIENWFFPKFTAIDSIDNRLRIGLLGFAMQSNSYRELYKLILDAYDTNLVHFRSHFVSDNHWSYDSRISEYFELVIKNASDEFGRPRYNLVASAISSLYYAAKRIRMLMHKYNFNSLEEYFLIYDKFQYNKAMYKLSCQMKLEESVMKNDPSLLECIDISLFKDSVLDSFDMKQILYKMKNDIAHSHKNKKKNEYIALHPHIENLHTFSEGF